MMKVTHVIVLSLATLLLTKESSGALNIITGLIQNNLVGIPVLFQEQNWPFDPEAGIRRSVKWQEENGVKGERLIERLGLGIDGNEERRLIEQRQRDEGHLGGLNYFQP